MTPTLNLLMVGMQFQKLTQLSQILVEAAIADRYPITAVQQDAQTSCMVRARHHVRFGVHEYGARLDEGEVDVLLGADLYEAARVGPDYLRDGGTLIVNSHVVPRTIRGHWGQIDPEGQERIMGLFRGFANKVIALDAVQMATEQGDAELMRFAMLGALCGTGVLPVGAETVAKVMVETVVEFERNVALKIFRAGLEKVATSF